jgi:hypothetical protein
VTRPGSRAACLGIAGPIENNICRATNMPWVVDGDALAHRAGDPARRPGQRLPRGGARASPRSGPTSSRPGRRPAGRAGTDRRAGRGHRPRPGVPALVAGPQPLPRRAVRGRPRRSRGAHAAGARPGRVPDGQVRPRVVRERVLSGRGSSTCFAFLAEEPACRA